MSWFEDSEKAVPWDGFLFGTDIATVTSPTNGNRSSALWQIKRLLTYRIAGAIWTSREE
jgi:hypothetical protein